MNNFFFIFSTVLLFLVTIAVAVDTVFGEMMWVTNNNYPGGDGAYLEAFVSVWYQTMGTGATVLLTVLSDALLVSS